jgi:retron-type reverse transcriptase
VRPAWSAAASGGKPEEKLKHPPLPDGRIKPSPLSPTPSNVVFNELDQELERRGHRFCRWAGDFVILKRSEKAARRVMESMTRYLEEELQLVVNREKS